MSSVLQVSFHCSSQPGDSRILADDQQGRGCEGEDPFDSGDSGDSCAAYCGSVTVKYVAAL